VSIASKADFVCWPQAGTNANLRPVAVFTDGYAYHVCPNDAQSRLADDLHKRRATIDSGQFVLWSITWDDVKEFEDQTAFPLHLFASNQRHFDHVARESRAPLSAKLMRENAVAQLLEYLAYPDRSVWQQTIFRLTVASLLPLRPPIEAGFLVALSAALQTQPRLPDLSIPAPATAGHQLYGISEPHDLRLLIHTHEGALRDPQQISVTLRLDDGFNQRVENDFRTAWRQFLLLANLYQFLPGFVPVTTEYVEQFGRLPVEPVAATATGPLSPDWQAAFAYVASACVDLLRVCQEAQLPAPIVGYELPNAAGRVAATAELAWEDRRVAIFLPDHAVERELFEQAGWQTFGSEQPADVVQALTR
jgi:DEAD/DEAH box helicase domain-containing protein